MTQFTVTDSHDLDHYRAQPGNWDVQALQLAPGSFHSMIRSLQFDDLVVYDNRWGAKSMIRGSSPQGWFMFGGVVRADAAGVRWCGQTADESLFAFTPERQSIEFVLDAGAHDVVILMRPDLLRRTIGEQQLKRLGQPGVANHAMKTTGR